MKVNAIIGALIALAAAVGVRTVLAQECPCDCYFSGDCVSGQFCNWGSLPVEDSCFWRQPKPQGVIGAGCDQDFNNWGQCDGICTGSASAGMFSEEDVPLLIQGVELWSEAFVEAAANGHGQLSDGLIQEIELLPFRSLEAPNDLGRIVIEIMMMARDEDFFVFPQFADFESKDVQVSGVSSNACDDTVSQLAVAGLAAEIGLAGSGAELIEQVPTHCLAGELLSRICADGLDARTCLYDRIQAFGEAIGRGGRDLRAAYAEGGPCSNVECENNIECDDGNPCTRDACEDGDCFYQNLPDPCDDGDPCTTGESCSAGSCGGGVLVTCDGPECVDCNGNNIPDECDSGEDCNENGILDECELEGNDCNGNGIIDSCEIFIACIPFRGCILFGDCNGNDVLDECELEGNDCNTNQRLDECDISSGDSPDDDANGIPDECECQVYGDVNGDGSADLDDVLCMIEGLSGVLDCVDVAMEDLDMHPCIGGNNDVNVLDLTSMLDTVAGSPPCDIVCE